MNLIGVLFRYRVLVCILFCFLLTCGLYISSTCGYENFVSIGMFEDKIHFLLAAFLSMGAFLLTLMNVFLFTLKKELFDSKEYELRYKRSGFKIGLYLPFINISKLFILTIQLCFMTSLSVVISFVYKNILLSCFIFSLSIVSIVCVSLTFYIVKTCFDSYLQVLSAK